MKNNLKKSDVRLVNEKLDLEVCDIIYPLKKVTKEDNNKIGLNYEIGEKVNFKLLVDGFTKKLDKLIVSNSRDGKVIDTCTSILNNEK